MDLSKYSQLIKVLTIIPLIIGILTFVEIVLPTTIHETSVVSKEENYRVKTGRTTYSIQFESIDDQFTQEIYETVKEGEQVVIEVTPIHKQIKSLTTLNGNTLLNDTGENYAIFAFGLVFILCSLVWLKKGDLSKRQSLYIALIIVLSIISGIRML